MKESRSCKSLGWAALLVCGLLVPFQFNEFYFAGFVCCGT